MCRIFETVTCLSNIFNLESRKLIFLPIFSTTFKVVLFGIKFYNTGGETKMRLAMAIGKCKSGHIMIRARCAHQPDHNRCTITQFHEKSLIQDFCKMQDKSKVLVYNLVSCFKLIVQCENRLKLVSFMCLIYIACFMCNIIHMKQHVFRLCIVHMCLKLFPNCFPNLPVVFHLCGSPM